MAGTTGLEPAASAVTGQRSNQLNYVPNLYTPTSTILTREAVILASPASFIQHQCRNAALVRIEVSLGNHQSAEVKAVQVESWLASLPLKNGT